MVKWNFSLFYCQISEITINIISLWDLQNNTPDNDYTMMIKKDCKMQFTHEGSLAGLVSQLFPYSALVCLMNGVK